MAITCPQPNTSVAVTAGVDADTVCIQGTLATAVPAPPAQARRAAAPATITVVVQVILGQAGQVPPNPPAQGTTPAVITGLNWCAQGVPVPDVGLTPPGAQLTAFAWQIDTSGSVTAAWMQPFFGLDSTVGGNDCCSGCGGSPSTMNTLAGALAGVQALLVSIADGVNAGDYTAELSDTLQWSVTIGGTDFTIAVNSVGSALVITGGVLASLSISIGFDPFSATFNGADFGSTFEVVVTEA